MRSALPARVLPACVLGAVLLVYLPHVGNGFVYDDHVQIEANPIVRGSAPLASAFTSDVWAHARPQVGQPVPYYRPLFVVANRVAFVAGGGSPRAFHIASLMLHLLVMALAYRTLRRLGLGPGESLAATALVGLSPLAGEVVYWAACLSEQLLLVGLLGALLCAIAARESRGKRRAALLVASALSTAAALLSKETGVVIAPLIALEALRAPRALRKRRLLEAVPAAVATGVVLVVRSIIVARVPFVAGASRLAVLEAVGRAGHAVLWDLRYLAFPHPLSPFHPSPGGEGLTSARVAGIALVVLAVLGGALLMRTRPSEAFWAGWIVLPLCPALFALFSDHPESFALHERYLLASVVPCAAVLVLAARRVRWAVVALVAVCLVGGLETFSYGYAFASDGAFFERAERVDPGSPVALSGIASERMKAGDYGGALPLLERAAGIEPRAAQVHLQLGVVLERLGRHDDALRELATGVKLGPGLGGAHLLLANALLASGRIDEAGAEYASELAVDPANVPARTNLGTYRFQTGDVRGAIDEWLRVARDAPGDVEVLFNLGLAFRQLGNRKASAAYLRRFLAISDASYAPQREQARRWLAE